MKEQKQTTKRIRKVIDKDITESQFMGILKKAAQPIKKAKSGSKTIETSESHLPDDCTGKNTH